MNNDERGHWEPNYVDPLMNVSATPQTIDPLLGVTVTVPPEVTVPEDVAEHDLPPYLFQEPEQAPQTTPDNASSTMDFSHDLDAILAEVLSSAPPVNDMPEDAVPEYIVPESSAPEDAAENEGQAMGSAAPNSDGYIPPWAVQAADLDPVQDIPPTPKADPSINIQNSVTMAIANVFETIQQGGSGSDAPFRGETPHRMQSGHSFDPETAAAVASAMASVFADLGKTRFSAQSDEVQDTPSQPHTGNYGSPTSLDDIVSSIMADASRRVSPRQVLDEDETIVDAEVYSVTDTDAQQTVDAAQRSTSTPSGPSAKVFEPAGQSTVFTPPPTRSEDFQASEASSAPKKGKKTKAPKPPKHLNASKTAHSSRGSSDAGARGHRRPEKYVIAAGAKAKGMRGKFSASKRSLNMAIKVKTMSSPSRIIPLMLALVLFVAAFGKFAVIDQFSRLNRAEQSVAELQSQLDTLTRETAGFADMEKAYSLYGTAWMTPEEIAQVDVLYGLDMCRQELLPASNVESIVIAKNLITVDLSGITLQQASAIINQLETYTMVKEAFVSSASSLDSASPMVAAIVPEAPILPEAPPMSPAPTEDLAAAPIIPEAPVLPGMPPISPAPTEVPVPTFTPSVGFDNGKNAKMTLSIILEDPATAIPEEVPTPPPAEGGTN